MSERNEAKPIVDDTTRAADVRQSIRQLNDVVDAARKAGLTVSLNWDGFVGKLTRADITRTL
jgi:hypothetical protein